MTTASILMNALRQNSLKESLEVGPNRALDHRDYLNRQMLNMENPIEVKPSSWQSINHKGIDALSKNYEFNNNDHLLYFVNETLAESNRIGHHPIMTIDHNNVEVILYTKDVNDITDIDIHMSKIIDEIFHDINFIEGL